MSTISNLPDPILSEDPEENGGMNSVQNKKNPSKRSIASKRCSSDNKTQKFTQKVTITTMIITTMASVHSSTMINQLSRVIGDMQTFDP